MNSKLCVLLCQPLACLCLVAGTATLRLLPSNPHYFEYGGKPTVLITSGEHYGAVLNLDFDGARYLDALAKDGLNLTRVFSGAYVEPAGAFGIERNTLAPASQRFICPWPRSETPGYAGGGNKFDLRRWDEAYFARLRDFVSRAERQGVIVELNLFCPFYEDSQWSISPMNAANNVSGVGAVARTNVYTLDRHGGLLEVQEAMVRRIVTELNPYPNVYFEICNEPYFGGVTIEWQYHIAQTIARAEEGLPQRHLISRNVANGSEIVPTPHPAISILNFHYAHPPTAVAANWGLNCPIGDNETGFRGTQDLPYRVEAWSFLFAGGALFNHLDYSFVAGHEDGTFAYPATQPGGGNAGFRRQMGVLRNYMRSLEFVRMQPMTHLTVDGPGVRAFGLARAGRDYAVYVGPELTEAVWTRGLAPGTGPLALAFEAPKGNYRLEWLDPQTGVVRVASKVQHGGGVVHLQAPSPRVDLVMRLRR